MFALLTALAFLSGGAGWVTLSAVTFLCAVLLGMLVREERGGAIGFPAGLFLALVQLAIGIGLMFVGEIALLLTGITPITMH
ncbi:hypothetical protein GM658_16485 [Pseudoduganella eburnea]|uniref:Uncharacterized protein n=2 Tax=Massilia eburnea TaxID=1776165 RepID=A0A6L6QJF2_9BURK|nr:hypothetical protein [Massilia eburnea]